jgi:hypothetical protein
MKSKILVLLAVFLCLVMLMVSQASALTITNSSSFNVSLNNSAYITQSTAASSLFSNELLTSGDETKSGTVAFYEIPYFNFASTLYFQFVFDMQETGGSGKRQLNIDDIVISVVGISTPLWNFDNTTYGSIILNSAEPFTNTPLGAGGDMELYVPVSLFAGMGLTGSNLLTLTVTQSQSDNGTDEWVVLGYGSGGSYFGPNDPINSNPIPIPSTVYLLGTSLIGLLVGRRKFEK